MKTFFFSHSAWGLFCAGALLLSPGQRAIIVSGYAETDRVQKAMELGARRYVKKPYTIGSLAKAVREALQSP